MEGRTRLLPARQTALVRNHYKGIKNTKKLFVPTKKNMVHFVSLWCEVVSAGKARYSELSDVIKFTCRQVRRFKHVNLQT